MYRRRLLSACLLFVVLSGVVPGTVPAGEAPAATLREARLPATSKARLAELATHPDWRVRKAVAGNRRTPGEVLARLARDPEPQVRISVATNISTPDAVYLVLARDGDVDVRSVVARYEYVPVAALKILAGDGVPRIRLEVARNWNTDLATLTRLSRDGDPDIAAIALQSLQKRREEAAEQVPAK